MSKSILSVAIAVAAVFVIAVGSGVLDDDSLPGVVALSGAFVAPDPGFRVVPPAIVDYGRGDAVTVPPSDPTAESSEPVGRATAAPGLPGAQPRDLVTEAGRATSGGVAGGSTPATAGTTTPPTTGGRSPVVPDASGEAPRPALPVPAVPDPPVRPTPSIPVAAPTRVPPVVEPTPVPPVVEPTPTPPVVEPTPTPPVVEPTLTPTSTPGPDPEPSPPIGSPWATCPWPATGVLPGLDLSSRDAFTDATGARVTVARDAGETADGVFDVVLRVVESTHPLAPGSEWFTDARRPFPADAGAVVLRGNPGNQVGPFRVVVEVSFHRAGIVQPGTAAPWTDSRVAVTAAMVVFDLDRTGAGHEQLGVDTRMGAGLSSDTELESVPANLADVRTWRATSVAPQRDNVDNAVLVVFDTTRDLAAQPLLLVSERTGNVGRDIVLGGSTPPLDTDAWVCQE